MPSGQEKPRAGLAAGRLAVFLQFLGATNRVLDSLDPYVPRSACYFDSRDRTKGGASVSRWSVIVPKALLRQIKSGKTAEPWTYDGWTRFERPRVG